MTADAPLILAWDLPNPISWTADKIAGFVGDAASEGFEAVIGGLVAWVMDAVIWIVGGVFHFFLDAQDPNVQADWFIGDKSAYATTAAMASILMVGFVLAGIAQGAMQGDVGGMLRRMAVDLPASVLGIVGLVTITQALIRLTDVLSSWVMAEFEGQIADFSAIVLSLSSLGGTAGAAFVVFALGSMTVMAGLVLVAELAVRAALVYIVVALAPLVFAAQLWPALRGVSQKLLRLLCGLIVAKLAMAVALAVAAAAAVGSGSGGEVTTLPTPEVFAEDPGGSVTQAVGVLLAAAVAFGVAAYMPFLVMKLFPLAEEAAVGQGVRGGPMRALQQGMSLMYYGQTLPRLTSGWPPGSAKSGPSGRSPRGPGSGGGGSGGGEAGRPGRRPSNPRGPQSGGGAGRRQAGSSGPASSLQGSRSSGQTAGRSGGGSSAGGSNAQAAGAAAAAAGPAGAAAGAAGGAGAGGGAAGAAGGGSAGSSGAGEGALGALGQNNSPARRKRPGQRPRPGTDGSGE